MEQAIRQRLRYLIEHGEMYPQERPLERRIGLALLGALVVLNVVEILLALLRH